MMLLAADTVNVAWVAQHLPSQYDEILQGTTNSFAVTYEPQSCSIRVTVTPSWAFNNARGDDHSKAFSVAGDTLPGKRLEVGENGDGTVDFTKIDPSSLRISDVDEYLGSERVRPLGFDFAFRNESDAKQMLAAMSTVIAACSASETPAVMPSPKPSPSP